MDAYSKDTTEVMKKRVFMEAIKYHHTTVSTPHLFLALFSFLSTNKETERYKDVYTKLRGSLNKYGVNGKVFKDNFLTFFPEGPELKKDAVINAGPDITSLGNEMLKHATAVGKCCEIEDLILYMFMDKSYDLYTILDSIISDQGKIEAMYDEIEDTFKYIAPKLQTISDLDECNSVMNVNTYVKTHKMTVINADEDIKKIEMALSGKSIRNCILTGPAGVGKTTYVYEFAQRINNGDVPDDFKSKIIYEVNSAALTAGTKYRGQFEQKLLGIIEVAKNNPQVILFIDEFHTFMNAGDSEGSSGTAGNIVKPYITRGDIQIIGATTNEEYNKYVTTDKAFASRFHEIKIAEPSVEETKQIILGLKNSEETFFKKNISDSLIDKIIDLSEKYSLEYANPRKSINMLEMACAYGKIFNSKDKDTCENDVINSIKLKYNVFISNSKVKETNDALHRELLGQDEAINNVVNDLKVVNSGLTELNKPLFSMILAGPTGTGKTETARIIAKYFFGSEDSLVKIDCGEYSNRESTSKLLGSAPGLIGSDDEPLLLKGVRQHPNSVVLFDEIEKADPSVQNILLNILDEGILTDNKGNKVSFRNTIIIFTTNLGCNTENKSETVGFFHDDTKSDKKERILKSIKNYFKAEWLGRLDDIVYYQNLSDDVINTLINRYLGEFQARGNAKNIKFTPLDYTEIKKSANIEAQGARGVRKAVKKQIISLENNEKELAVSTDF